MENYLNLATEIACSSKFGYKCIGKSIISDHIRSLMDEKIQTISNLGRDTVKICGCKTDHAKSGDSSGFLCKFWNTIASSDTCSETCQNQAFDKDFFAVQEMKLYIGQDEMDNWGLFAYEDIPKYTYIGEYKGVLEEALPAWTGNSTESRYCVQIPQCGFYINASHHASAMRCVKQSSNPTCFLQTFKHDGMFKVIVVAAQSINAGDEITVRSNTLYRDIGCETTPNDEEVISKNKKMFNRFIQDCVEIIANDFINELPPEMSIEYNDACRIISKILTKCYLAKQVKNCRFLSYEHYLRKIETERSNSVKRRWCSICDLGYTFQTASSLHEHYTTCHYLRPNRLEMPEVSDDGLRESIIKSLTRFEGLFE